MMRFGFILLFTILVNFSHAQMGGWNTDENQLKIMPIGFATDYFQRGNSYKTDRIILGLAYERELSNHLSVNIPIFLSVQNFFIYTLPQFKFYPNVKDERVSYFSLGIALNNGRLNTCVPTNDQQNITTTDINRTRLGVFGGFGFSPKLSEHIRLNIDNNIGWYVSDNAFDYIGTNCNAFGKEILPQLISSVGLIYSF